jgi:hypothetical protein
MFVVKTLSYPSVLAFSLRRKQINLMVACSISPDIEVSSISIYLERKCYPSEERGRKDTSTWRR